MAANAVLPGVVVLERPPVAVRGHAVVDSITRWSGHAQSTSWLVNRGG